MATPFCDDPKAYASIPDRFFDCLISRRHSFPLSRQQRQNVVIRYDGGGELHLTEYYGACDQCGATRKLFRDRYARTFVTAEYDYPDGYLAPPGTKWDPDLLWAEYQSRHPVKGRARSVTRSR
jgi:hypothetical protein